MKFNLEYYRSFFMTANFLSFTKAAEQLCLTQSAVSQSTKKLEGELGCKLFLRTAQGLQLTAEGTILYAHVKKAFEELQTGEYCLMKLGNYKMGELRIGATETSLRFFLPHLIQSFKHCFPNIHVTFIGTTTMETCKYLLEGTIELAFLMAPVSSEFPFELFKIQDVQDVFIAHKDFPIDFEKTHSLEEISQYPLISISQENSVRTYIDQWFFDNDILFVPEYTVKGTGLILPLVQNCLGIGIIPYEFVRDEVEKGDLVPIKIEQSLPPRAMYLATNPHNAVSAIGQEFFRYITDTFLCK